MACGGWEGGEKDDPPGFPGVRPGSPVEIKGFLPGAAWSSGRAAALKLGRQEGWGAGWEGDFSVFLGGLWISKELSVRMLFSCSFLLQVEASWVTVRHVSFPR